MYSNIIKPLIEALIISAILALPWVLWFASWVET